MDWSKYTLPRVPLKVRLWPKAVAAKPPLKQREFDSESERKAHIHELQSHIAMIFAVTKVID